MQGRRGFRVLAGGTIEVRTFKAGLLSKIAHDLLLRFDVFEVSTNGEAVRVSLKPESLKVVHALAHGQPAPDQLSVANHREIEQNIREQVLHTNRHPQSMYEGSAHPTPTGYLIEGQLTLVGTTRPVQVEARRQDQRLVGEVELRPSDFGIAHFKALLGAIKLQDKVVVRFDLPERSS
jgi:hypothetical protein